MQLELDWRGVATARLIDGHRRNPLSSPIIMRLRDFLRALADERDTSPAWARARVRCVAIEATGPVFSAGHDFADFAGASDADARTTLDACAELNLLLGRIPQVSVAAVGGAALAGGAQLAASCDIVLAHAEAASFCLPGVHRSGFCHTPAVALGARVGARAAFALAALGHTVGAHEAAAIGLATRVVGAATWRTDVDATTGGLAARFGPNSAEGKRVFFAQAGLASTAERYTLATDAMVGMFSSDEYQRSMRDFLGRRKEGAVGALIRVDD